MRIRLTAHETNDPIVSAFTLPEVLMAVVIILITFGGFYLGFTQGFAVIQVARENLRATQILQEKLETIRLFTWTDIQAAQKISPPTTNYFYPLAPVGSQGTAFRVERLVGASPITDSNYSNDVKLVTFTVKWTSGRLLRQRQMKTFVSQYGLHNYIVFGRY